MVDSGSELEPITHRDIANLANAIERLTSVVNALSIKIDETYVRKDVLDPQLQDIRRDIQGHSDALTWAIRIVIGLVIVAVIGLAMNQGVK